MKTHMTAAAAAPETVTNQARPTLMQRLAAIFTRSRKKPLARNPFTPEERALITNHSAMR